MSWRSWSLGIVSAAMLAGDAAAMESKNYGELQVVKDVDLNKYIDPDGVWTDTVNGVKVRTFDKMHLSAAGAQYVATWLMPQLEVLNRPGRPQRIHPRFEPTAGTGSRVAVSRT